MTILKTLAAGLIGLVAFGAAQASAGDRSDYDHDRRAHKEKPHDYYKDERRYRGEPYRSSGVSLSIRIGDDGYRRGDRYYRDDRYYRSRQDRRILHRQVFDTRYRARIVLIEEVVYTRRGNRRLVCTVRVRGPEADYVSRRRMNRIADRNCSPRARIRIRA